MAGFKPFEDWVPMPIPSKELGFARILYQRGENTLMATPDFVDFANDIGKISSRTQIIMKGKLLIH